MQFSELPLHDSTQAAIEAMGFTETTPIQASAIPPLLEGRDLVGQARTGTGKTAAFGVPLIEAARDGKRGIVLTPTRELAKQVQQELQAIGKGSPVDVICLIGGAPFGDQVRSLQRHPKAIIVATPGRVVDHLGRGTLNLGDIGILVLDEADEMLSMGFQDEVDAIIAAIPKERQTILFSATLAPAIESLAKRALRNPVTVRMGAGAAPEVKQTYALIPGRDRKDAIARILEWEAPRAALLFARTRIRVEELVEGLRHLGAEALHGGMGQPVREAVMRRFRDGRTKLLIATDVAARGLDVNEIDLVLHDEPADDVDTYIHRIGRTGRAGRLGTSILFLPPGKTNRLASIKRVAGTLEKYQIPGTKELGEARALRLIKSLRENTPSAEAKKALQLAITDGMDVQEIALSALEALLGPQAAAAEATPEISRCSGLALKIGTMDRVQPGAIVGMLINTGGLTAEQIGRIDILEKMSVVEVPESEVQRLCEELGDMRYAGRPLYPRPADDWRFKTGPKRFN